MSRSIVFAAALAFAACTYNTTNNNYGPPPDAAGSGSNDADADAIDAAPHAPDGGGDDADAAAADAAPIADASPSSDAAPHADAAPQPDATPAADAPPLSGDTTSCGHPLPTTAPATLTFSGAVLDTSGTTGVTGATIAIYRRGAGTPLATTTSDAQGAYSMTVATGGAPIDGYLRMSAAGYVATNVYPAVPFVADWQSSVPIVDQSTFVGIGGSGQVPQDPHQAYAIAIVVDCSNQPLAGAILTTAPAGDATVSYPDSNSSSGIFLTSTSSSGYAIANNLTPGDVLVDGTAGATSLRGHLIEARTDELLLVEVSP